MPTNLHALDDPALAWLASQLRWERTLERLRLRHALMGRQRRAEERSAA